MNPDKPFPPYDAPGPDGLPLTNEHVAGIPIADNSRKLAKDVVKLAKVKMPNRMPKARKPKFKSDVKFY